MCRQRRRGNSWHFFTKTLAHHWLGLYFGITNYVIFFYESEWPLICQGYRRRNLFNFSQKNMPIVIRIGHFLISYFLRIVKIVFDLQAVPTNEICTIFIQKIMPIMIGFRFLYNSRLLRNRKYQLWSAAGADD